MPRQYVISNQSERRGHKSWLQYGLILLVIMNFGFVMVLYIDDTMTSPGLHQDKLVNFRKTVMTYAKKLTDTTSEPNLMGLDLPTCNDTVWCNIALPATSYFNFEPPRDRLRWRLAQLAAAEDDRLLLHRSREHFPSPFHFVGSDHFRALHRLADSHTNRHTMLAPLTHNQFVSPDSNTALMRYLSGHRIRLRDYLFAANAPPSDYTNLYSNRSPIVYIGHNRFERYNGHFSGPYTATMDIPRYQFLSEFAAARTYLNQSAVFLTPLEEDWGWLSTSLIGRIEHADRKPPSVEELKLLQTFLNDDHVLLVATHQHSAIRHRKLMTLPVGVAEDVNRRKTVWDMLQTVEPRGRRRTTMPERTLLAVVDAHKSKHAERIVTCVSRHFSDMSPLGATPRNVNPNLIRITSPPEESQATEARTEKRDTSSTGSSSEGPGSWSESGGTDAGGGIEEYLISLQRSLFFLVLPTPTYDQHSVWEALLMGSVGVLERRPEFEQLFWRLPVMFVESFSQVTPQMLQQAYVEALYRCLGDSDDDGFDWDRLGGDFWIEIIYKISGTRTIDPYLDKFPISEMFSSSGTAFALGNPGQRGTPMATSPCD